MRILEYGNRYKRDRQFLCTSCWCKFEATYDEYYEQTRVDGGHVHPYIACKCPECGCEAGELKTSAREICKINNDDATKRQYGEYNDEPGIIIRDLSFSAALTYLKDGHQVWREGWNGEGVYVILIPSYEGQLHELFRGMKGLDVIHKMNSYMVIKNTDGTWATWVPSVRDCLAEDWVVCRFAQ